MRLPVNFLDFITPWVTGRSLRVAQDAYFGRIRFGNPICG